MTTRAKAILFSLAVTMIVYMVGVATAIHLADRIPHQTAERR